MNSNSRFTLVCAIASWTLISTVNLHAQPKTVDAAASWDARRTIDPDNTTSLRPVDVTINQSSTGQWTLLEHAGDLYATPEILHEWRILAPAGITTFRFRETDWIPLHALAGYHARFDFTNQALQLEFAPEAFVTTQMKKTRSSPLALSQVSPAAFLNYDLSHTLSKGTGVTSSHNTGILTELGFAFGTGTLISSQLGRNIGSSDPNTPSEWKRLETTWTRDFHENNFTLRLGDTNTRAAMWGRNLYFGGLQLGTNFGLTPGFLSQPLPTLAGTASSPGTVELYVNNALRQVSNVPAGPFTVENFTQVTGTGEARIVVRDVLGRESVIVSPFFTSSQLLEKGLSDWSINLGKERYNLGTLSADYREPFTSGLYRQGLSKTFTLEGRAEWSKPLQTVGLGFNTQLPFLALGQAALAFSRDEHGLRGSKALLGIDQQNLANGFNARVVVATRDYRELGFNLMELPYKMEQSINFRHTFDDKASVGLSWARLVNHDQNYSTVMTGSYTMRISERGSLIFSGTHVTGTQSGFAAGLSLVLPLEKQRVTTASMSHTKSGVEGYAATTQPIGAEAGVGWRVLAGHLANDNHAEAGLYVQGGQGFLGADMAASGNNQTLRLNAQGALVYMENRMFAARRLQDSFALVQVPGYPNVGVGFQGETITRTNKEGFALLPRLAAYQTNNIRLNASDLPISAELDNIETTTVPSWRSGVVVKFPVRTGHGGLLRILQPNGEPVPPGARVELIGDGKEFFVARRGEVFLTGLQLKNSIRLQWGTATCRLEFEIPKAVDDEIMRLGPWTCQEVSP